MAKKTKGPGRRVKVCLAIRGGGRSRESRYRLFETAFGRMAIVAEAGQLVGVLLPDADQRRLESQVNERWPTSRPDARLMPDLVRQVRDYFKGGATEFDVPLAIKVGGDFRRRALEACREIPFGQTISYGELARRAGRPTAARAAGQAMANNPLPLIVPCHRVVSAGGALTGFGACGGVALKKRMLDLERRVSAGRPGRTRG